MSFGGGHADRRDELGDAAATGGAGVVEQLVRVLAHPGLFVQARDIVPFDAVAVEVVEDSHAALLASAFLVFAAVGLSLADSSGVGPVGVGLGDFFVCSRHSLV